MTTSIWVRGTASTTLQRTGCKEICHKKLKIDMNNNKSILRLNNTVVLNVCPKGSRIMQVNNLTMYSVKYK
jgi:hypothetical protein